MSTNLFLTIVGGVTRRVQAISASAGVADANKIVATGSDGRLDNSVMPVGIGAAIETMPASEALVAGDFVNVWNDTGTRRARKADASNNRPANGFVIAAVSSGANASVYTNGLNTALTGLNPGETRFLGTAGASTATAQSSPNIHQVLGVALSATSLQYEYDQPIALDA